MHRLVLSWIILLLFEAGPAFAQTTQSSAGSMSTTQPQQAASPTRTGEVAQSQVGQAGQRQTREIVDQKLGVNPMARINTRLQNRVQSRVRNRIDRNYDPTANATSPFAVASEQLQNPAPRR